jgi:hypothetical protein
MPTGTLAPVGRQRVFTDLGTVPSGALLYTWVAGGVTTPLATYSDYLLTTPNANPQVSSAFGLFGPIYLRPGLTYCFELKTSAGVLIWQQDYISAVPSADMDVDITGVAGVSIAALDVVYLSDGSGSLTAGRWYKADADLAYASNSAVLGMAPAAIASGAAGTIRTAGRITGLSGLTIGTRYYVSGTAGALSATQGKFRRLVGVADSATSLVLDLAPPFTAPPAPCNVLAFGAVADSDGLGGGTDNTAAFQAAVDAATLAGHAEVHIPAGCYRQDGTVTMHEGIPIIGVGGQGSSYISGTTIYHTSTSDCFVWDGNGVSTLGTGGALKNILIVKKTGVSGGVAVKIIATSDNFRPGEMQLENVLIYGDGTGLWSKGIFIDGSACVTVGSRGVRSVQFSKVRVADCTSNNQYIHITAGVHITGTHVQIDTGHGSGTTGMTIDGFSENHAWSNLNINGALVLGATVGDLFHCTFNGVVTTFTQGNSDAVGAAMLSLTSATNLSRFFNILGSNNARFLAVRTTEMVDATGDGTAVTVLYDSETFDVGGNFSIATGRFTAPRRGVYHFDATVTVQDCGAAHTVGDYWFMHRDAAAAGINVYQWAFFNPSSNAALPGMAASTGIVGLSGSLTIEMNASETMEVQVVVSGSTKTVDIYGAAASNMYTSFSGSILP